MAKLDIGESILVDGQFFIVDMINADGYFLSCSSDPGYIIFLTNDNVVDIMGNEDE